MCKFFHRMDIKIHETGTLPRCHGACLPYSQGSYSATRELVIGWCWWQWKKKSYTISCFCCWHEGGLPLLSFLIFNIWTKMKVLSLENSASIYLCGDVVMCCGIKEVSFHSQISLPEAGFFSLNNSYYSNSSYIDSHTQKHLEFDNQLI